MSAVRLTHIGGPTVLIEVEGWRILTDPTLDPPGRTYVFPWAAWSRKLRGPAISAADLGPLDLVLLSHDQHDDNLDAGGYQLLSSVPTVVTTASGERRLRVNVAAHVTGLQPWQETAVSASDRPTLTITATPCRHGPRFSHPFVGDVIGFAVRWDGQSDGVLWISGDTVLYDGVREVAGRVPVDVALVHLGSVQFPVTGPLRYTLTAREGVELCRLIRPRRLMPVHYEGWSHFREGRDAVEREFARAPDDIRERVRWLPIGIAQEIDQLS
jgi:L-ascorbate metabolism protein UlaG (beta-lactamase superfamily)